MHQIGFLYKRNLTNFLALQWVEFGHSWTRRYGKNSIALCWGGEPVRRHLAATSLNFYY